MRRLTFHGLFWSGLVLMGGLLALATLWSWLASGADRDWLLDGRYVELRADRYPPGSVTHFAFDQWRPPRPVGFYLVVDEGGRAVALSDRIRGCVLAWRADRGAWVDPCRGAAYPLARVLRRDPAGGALVYLPVTRRDGRWRVDLAPVLHGR